MFSRNVAFVGAIITALSLVVSAHADPKRYLVQFKSQATYFAASQSMTSASIKFPFDAVQGNQMHLLGTTAAVTKNLPNVQMMVIESDDALAIQSLKSHPAIAYIEEEFFHPPPEPIIARKKGGGKDDSGTGTTQNATMDMPWGISAVKAPQAWAITRGSGARVMVLDTGIDQGHPVFAGQIEAVQNFTGGDVNDVTDDEGHGSHVSGTILANGVNGGLTGVAPEAKELMGKVCTKQGCSNVAIASGLDWAVTEKVDVVNMSLGGALMSQAEATAMQAAETAGVLVIAASGNDGKGTVSFPAASATAVAVGAIDINLQKADFSNWGPELAVVGPGVDVISSVPRGTGRGATILMNLDDGKGTETVNSLPLTGSPVGNSGTNSVVFCNLGNPTDFVNVTGKIALINRGTIPFKDKVTNAIAAGAIGVLIANNAPGLIPGTVTTDGTEVAIPVVMIEQSVGAAAQAALAAGHAITSSVAVIPTDYASFQGTSMATPHVTGVAALIRAANKSLTPAQVRALLKSTATPLTPNDQNQLGSGLVNAEAAVGSAAKVIPMRQVAN